MAQHESQVDVYEKVWVDEKTPLLCNEQLTQPGVLAVSDEEASLERGMLKVALVFTLGCSILVCNAVLSFLPYTGIQLQLPSWIIYVEGILSVISCSIFLAGSTFSFLEVLATAKQPERLLDQNLISARAIVGAGTGLTLIPDVHYVNLNSSHGELFNHATNYSAATDSKNIELSKPSDSQTEKSERLEQPVLKSITQYLELGIIASAIFTFCSFVYWSTSLASLVTIFELGIISREIRFPQLVAAFGFAIASAMLIIKTQRHQGFYWYRPALHSLGWHINAWNLVGSAGFIFCAYYGILGNTQSTDFQFGCSYLWGK